MSVTMLRRLVLLLAAGAALLATGDAAALAKSRHQHAAYAVESATDISAARRHHRRTQVRVYPRSYAAPPAPPAPAPFAFRPADPSFGPYYSLWNARRQEPNRCIEDLGYGRWRYCDWD